MYGKGGKFGCKITTDKYDRQLKKTRAFIIENIERIEFKN